MARSLDQSCTVIGVVAHLLAGIALSGTGVGSAYFLRTRYDISQIADERGGAGLLLVAMIGSFVFALTAFAIGAYAAFVCWLMPV